MAMKKPMRKYGEYVPSPEFIRQIKNLEEKAKKMEDAKCPIN